MHKYAQICGNMQNIEVYAMPQISSARDSSD
jgi:hypothetical protein